MPQLGVDEVIAVTDQVLILEAGRADRQYWRDLWNYRELFFILAWRDVSVRYKQTMIGIAWAALQPFLTMLILTVVFGKLAKLPSDGQVPYPLMVFAGILPWSLFSASVSHAADSIVSNSGLISKVYFPRLIIPVATIVTALIDLAISLSIMILLMGWYRFIPGWQILMLPLFVVLAVAASIGPGLWISSLNVKYRDFRYVIPFILQLGLYASPVGFSSSIVPESWRLIYSLNPMVGVIDGFRWCLLGRDASFDGRSVAIGVLVQVLFLWVGIRTFRRTERSFADLV